jgi:hypothetical protein
MLSPQPIHWADPRTWPWVIYVWIVFLLAGGVKPAWRWFQRRQGQGWPTVQGRIESVDVHEKKQFIFSARQGGRTPAYVAELNYSYTVDGQYHAGRYEREFGGEEEGREFIRDLQGNPVAVAYNPQKTKNSTLSQESLATLIAMRPPAPDPYRTARPVSSLPRWVRPLLWPFIVLAAVGLVVSLWVHLGAVGGKRVAPETFFFMLHIGVFVVFAPAIFVAQRLVGNTARKDFWKAALRWSPNWMRYMVYGFGGYAFVNFALFIFRAPPHGGSGNPPAVVWRGFSGHWMVFYCASMAILYSAVNSPNDSDT